MGINLGNLNANISYKYTEVKVDRHSNNAVTAIKQVYGKLNGATKEALEHYLAYHFWLNQPTVFVHASSSQYATALLDNEELVNALIATGLFQVRTVSATLIVVYSTSYADFSLACNYCPWVVFGDSMEALAKTQKDASLDHSRLIRDLIKVCDKKIAKQFLDACAPRATTGATDSSTYVFPDEAIRKLIEFYTALNSSIVDCAEAENSAAAPNEVNLVVKEKPDSYFVGYTVTRDFSRAYHQSLQQDNRTSGLIDKNRDNLDSLDAVSKPHTSLWLRAINACKQVNRRFMFLVSAVCLIVAFAIKPLSRIFHDFTKQDAKQLGDHYGPLLILLVIVVMLLVYGYKLRNVKNI